MQFKKVPVLVVVVLITSSAVLAGTTALVMADTEYEMTIDGTIDTPTREVDIEGSVYEVSAITKANSGDSLDVSVQAPADDQIYRVYLYNSDRQIVKGNSGEGDQTVTFNLSDLDAGTYLFAIQEEGVNQVIQPLVIKGYETSLDAPTSATVGDEVTIDITIEQLTDNVTADRVEVVVAGDDSLITEPATDNGDEYTATVDTSNLESGSFSVYATVRGEKSVFERKIIYGVSDSQKLSLDSASENTDDNSDGSDGGNGGGSGDGSSDDGSSGDGSSSESSSDSDEETESTDSTEGSDTTNDDDDASGEESNTGTTNSDESSSDDGSADSDEDTTDSSDSSTGTNAETPGFGVPSVAILLCSIGLFMRMRSH